MKREVYFERTDLWTSQWPHSPTLFWLLYACDGKKTAQQLAAFLPFPRMRIQRLLQKLEYAGYIRRLPAPDDRIDPELLRHYRLTLWQSFRRMVWFDIVLAPCGNIEMRIRWLLRKIHRSIR